MNRTIVVRVFPMIFAVVGAGLLLLGGLLVRDSYLFTSSATKVNGTVVEIESRYDSDDDLVYRPVVEYPEPAGGSSRFTEPMWSGLKRYRVGERVEVAYSADGEARIVSFFSLYGAGLIFAAIGAVFAAVGGGMEWRRRRRQAQIRRLLQRGTRVMATVVELTRDQRISVNDVHPYILQVEAEDADTGARRRFTSDRFWELPKHLPQPGDEVKVVFDPDDPEVHWVDLTAIGIHPG
ncbi:DUF3592 domain-containing protein [Haliangium sp.]|uniref:DUF3592 domain-containing protein n=1 Tax=Haliangium sp. TaxID=2663208 RepID=UPI003D0D36DF